MSKIMELANEAGFDSINGKVYTWAGQHNVTEELNKFYTLARADLEAELAAATKTNAAHVPLILNLEAENAKLRDRHDEISNALFRKGANTRRIKAENAKLRDALKKVQGDINWMLNTKQFLSGFVFDYIDEAMEKTND